MRVRVRVGVRARIVVGVGVGLRHGVGVGLRDGVGVGVRARVRAHLRGVDRELLRDDEHRLGELRDGELLAAADGGGEVLEVDGERRLDAARLGVEG